MDVSGYSLEYFQGFFGAEILPQSQLKKSLYFPKK